ncbi:hypothetical protein ARMSODRAFT_117793 [Armillaria solidipes]|uniref:Uncharacterized protein n=1 Tax=Armillaria solidipes TaxID=1076256 RepID=A0A2H3B665_9AGAR|nr:hypothetical protein ARMSODRAFT_117793 [Armillaria solidipes]
MLDLALEGHFFTTKTSSTSSPLPFISTSPFPAHPCADSLFSDPCTTDSLYIIRHPFITRNPFSDAPITIDESQRFPPPSSSVRGSLDSLLDHHIATTSTLYRSQSKCHTTLHLHHMAVEPCRGVALSSASEMSSVVYIPPSDAPRYRREGYNCDEGFSKDLETEVANRENQ